MKDHQLLDYYLAMHDSEAYPWNASPASLYLELETREFFNRNIPIIHGMKACNIGIGTGDWDDYIAYQMGKDGQLTSLDIDQMICDLFGYRQLREGHPYPSTIVNEDVRQHTLPSSEFDLVTMIGSTLREIGHCHETLIQVRELLKSGGSFMLMCFEKDIPQEQSRILVESAGFLIKIVEGFTRFKQVECYAMVLMKP